MKKLAIILLTALVMPNVNAALSVSKTVAIHAPLPSTATCELKVDYWTDSEGNKQIHLIYCDIPANFNYSYFTYRSTFVPYLSSSDLDRNCKSEYNCQLHKSTDIGGVHCNYLGINNNKVYFATSAINETGGDNSGPLGECVYGDVTFYR